MSGHGKYTIVRKIADGGMAEIFLAQLHGPQGFQKPVVLKRIRRTFSSDPSFRRMLVGEAHVAMGLNHSNIVQILDLGEAAGNAFLVLELVDGWSVDQLLKRADAARLPLPRELALYITIEICRALAYAHQRSVGDEPLGIVHRDISPHNLLVSEHAEVKLTDFGIAKARNRSESTAKNVVKGKIAFMSPEQATGAKVDSRSDLFSLGSVLYLMVTGRHAFEGATDLETMVRVQACEFVSPAKLKARPEPELTRFILRAMERLPSARFQTAQEMLEAAEKLLRSTFRVSGQTELKRWLDELGRADSVPPISRVPATGLREEDGSLEDPLELSDSDLLPAAPPPPPPPSSVGRPRRVASPRKLRGKAWALGLAAAAVFAIGAALVASSARRVRSVAGASPPAGSPHGPESLGAAQGPSDAGLAAATQDAGAVAAAEVDGGAEPLASAPGADPDGSPMDAEPGPELAVGDGGAPPSDEPPSRDEAASPAASGAGARGDSRAAPAPEPEEEAPPPVRIPRAPTARLAAAHVPAPLSFPRSEMVSVLISSQPEGAVVRLSTRTFGKTPIHIRFRPGLLFELSFSLEGYQAQSKRIQVSNRPDQKVFVYLKRGALGSAASRKRR